MMYFSSNKTQSLLQCRLKKVVFDATCVQSYIRNSNRDFLVKQFHALTYINKSKYVTILNFYLLQSPKFYRPTELLNKIPRYPGFFFS